MVATVGAVAAVAVAAVALNREARQRAFSFFWVTLGVSASTDAAFGQLKRSLLAAETVSGDVLDLGAGTGVNVKHVARAGAVSSYTAVEPNVHFHALLRQEAAAHLPEGTPVHVTTGSAGGVVLPVPDDSVDVVVATLVLCSVPDPAGTVAEVRRVLRPGGRFVFLEHVAAPADRRGLRLAQKAVTVSGLWALFGDGCDVERDTGAVIADVPGGWQDVNITSTMSDMGPPFVRPIVYGRVVKG